MRVRNARPDDAVALRDVEHDAGQLFAEIGMTEVAAHPAAPVEELTARADLGQLFVAEVQDRLVGYVVVGELDGAAHIEQVSVRRAYGRRGIGRALVSRALQWARDNGFRRVTLTTFREVPFNGPFYRRLGFRELPMDAETEGLRRVRAHEARIGLDQWPRTCMVLSLGDTPTPGRPAPL
jgi:GNAT superfamily N-acetyltransferase